MGASPQAINFFHKLNPIQVYGFVLIKLIRQHFRMLLAESFIHPLARNNVLEFVTFAVLMHRSKRQIDPTIAQKNDCRYICLVGRAPIALGFKLLSLPYISVDQVEIKACEL